MKYQIYQIKDTRNTIYSFVGWSDATEKDFSMKDYKLVYSGEIEPNGCLDKLFEIFNINHTDDYKGRSMSVSDVIALLDDGDDEKNNWKWYYCDSFGWENITEVINRKETINGNLI